MPQRNLACWNHAEVETGRRYLKKAIWLLDLASGIQAMVLPCWRTKVCNNLKGMHSDDQLSSFTWVLWIRCMPWNPHNFIHHENLYVYGNTAATKQLWYWSGYCTVKKDYANSYCSSVSCQLIGSKSNPTFSPVKIPYRAHSSLNTAIR